MPRQCSQNDRTGGESRQKPKRTNGQRSSKNDGPFFFKNPLSEIPRDQLRLALIKHGADFVATFRSLLADVLSILKSHEPLQLLCMLSGYGLTAGVDDTGGLKPLTKDSKIIQSHVELAQALALTLPGKDLSSKPPDPPILQKMLDLLPMPAQSFAEQRYAALSKDRTEAEQAIVALQEYLRLHTQHVRNWGYFDKVIRIIRDL